jgi:hypothetical protein
MRLYRKQNPKAVKRARDRYRKGLGGKKVEAAARHARYKKNRTAILEKQAARNHGITLEEYRLLKARQKNRCAICDRRPKKGKRLCIDHCHRTKKVRGLLCVVCNVTVGFLEKNLMRTTRAQQYLVQYG